jgi:glycosyltransferase involved in cell wall biosynthesis
LFDDLEGILPRPKNHIELANEINKIFNSKEYTESLIEKSFNFVLNNSWNKSANKYLEVYDDIINRENNEIHGL